MSDVTRLVNNICCLENDSTFRAKVEFLLREAMEEAVNADRKIWDAQHVVDLKLHVEQAYQRAAKVARNWEFDCGYSHNEFAAAIEKLARERGGETKA
jgi:hypothetical protein